MIICALVEAFEFIELLTVRRGATDQAAAPTPRRPPFISIHVPICSEPPEVVARTLGALSNLRYEAFEVLVVDNNTKDERLWRPIETLCGQLGARFRFFHLETWPGFKAGALNFALQNTAKEASLIGIIDADYETAPEFLNNIIGYFEDESIAFVQTPQDYRDWGKEAFSRMCYWEYWQVFAVSMNLRNRRNAILMHGTMSLVRKDAVQRAGGWAEWCLTEDSEMGLRLLADGFRGIYVRTTYGRGLVPFTYRDYKRQRRRWVIGGVQQFKRHISLFIPRPGRTGRMSILQLFDYLRGWLLWFRDCVIVVSVPLACIGTVAILSGLVEPDVFWILAIGLFLIVAQLVTRQIIVYRIYLAASWRDTLGAMVANVSLIWTIGWAWLAGLATQDHVFQRTPKRSHSEPSWVEIARGEMIASAITFLLGIVAAIKFGLSGWGVIVTLWSYTIFFTPAVWMAWCTASNLDPTNSLTPQRNSSQI